MNPTVDTVHLRHVYETPLPEREAQQFTRARDGSLIFDEPKPKGFRLALPRIIYRQARDEKHYLTVTVSLPKMMYGDNVRTMYFEDIEIALEQISTFASHRTGLEFDAKTASVSRVDFASNFQVGEENVFHYLRAVERASLPRMERSIIGNARDTILFSHGSEQIELYSKHAETAKLAREGKASDDTLRASIGLLRLERRFLRTNAVKRLASRLGLSDRSSETILQESIAEKVLIETMKNLGLSQNVESKDSRFNILREYCGSNATLYKNLVYFVALADAYGEAKLLEQGFMPRSSFYKNRNHIKKAGVLITTPARKSLPPLRLVRTPSATVKRAASFL